MDLPSADHDGSRSATARRFGQIAGVAFFSGHGEYVAARFRDDARPGGRHADILNRALWNGGKVRLETAQITVNRYVHHMILAGSRIIEMQ